MQKNELLTDIEKIAHRLQNVTLMEVCGGHTNTIMRYGIRDILPKNITLISGPGCPVCVTSQHDIDSVVALGRAGIPIATYGDALRVPGSVESLEDARGHGAKVFEVYSTTEVLALATKHPDIVFFGIGFETTAPMTAFLLQHNITVYSSHKLIPPAMQALVKGAQKIDGFINPGHVSAIIGTNAYTALNTPQVISGFAPEQILNAIRLLLQMIADRRTGVVNDYPEVVSDDGNTVALEALSEQFTLVDSDWRGLGMIPKSGLEVNSPVLNARVKYQMVLAQVKKPKGSGCRCGDILTGMIEPLDCPLYKTQCTPESPQGACMVSEEGSCAIYYRYEK